jgi:hypothetical protein
MRSKHFALIILAMLIVPALAAAAQSLPRSAIRQMT